MSKLFKATLKQGSKSSSVVLEANSWESVLSFLQAVTTQKVVEIYEISRSDWSSDVCSSDLYAGLAFSRNKLLIDSLDFKAKLGRFSNSDVKQIKRFSAPDDMSFRGLDVNDLKPLQGIHMVKDTQGRYIGRAELDFAMLSYYGYMPPNH